MSYSTFDAPREVKSGGHDGHPNRSEQELSVAIEELSEMFKYALMSGISNDHTKERIEFLIMQHDRLVHTVVDATIIACGNGKLQHEDTSKDAAIAIALQEQYNGVHTRELQHDVELQHEDTSKDAAIAIALQEKYSELQHEDIGEAVLALARHDQYLERQAQEDALYARGRSSSRESSRSRGRSSSRESSRSRGRSSSRESSSSRGRS
jgi:hypothetical protein